MGECMSAREREGDTDEDAFTQRLRKKTRAPKASAQRREPQGAARAGGDRGNLSAPPRARHARSRLLRCCRERVSSSLTKTVAQGLQKFTALVIVIQLGSLESAALCRHLPASSTSRI